MRNLLTAALSFAALSATVLAQGAVVAPCFETSFGVNLNLADDSVAQGQVLGFVFPGPGGLSTPTIDISSNGFVWLGSNPDSGCCDGNEAKFLTRGPRIAPLWVDLDPGASGAVWFNTFPASGPVPARAVVTWDAVPEFQGNSSMTFQLQLFADGSVLMFFDPTAGIFAHTGLTGITEGVAATSNQIDILGTASSPHDSGTNPTVFETHFFFFDLAASAWTFSPNGQGGYAVTSQAACAFASVTSVGVGCPKPATTYELFDPANPFDLANTALEFIPTGGGGYVVTPIAGFFSGFTGVQTFFDDQSQGPFNLPFTFQYPGGSTSAIDISSNGFIWLQAGNFNSRCCNGDEFSFTTDAASIAGMWMDLYPPGATSGGIYFDTVGTTEAHITWSNVPEFSSGGSNTFQITLRSDNSFRLSWGSTTNVSHDALVGFSSGAGTTPPGSIDFSSGTFTTSAGGTPLLLSPQPGSRPQLGATFGMNVDQITPGSALGIMLFGLSSFPTGIDLAFLGMPDCSLYVSLDAQLAFPLTGTPTPYAFGVPSTSTLIGTVLHAQATTLTPGATPFGLLTSNGLSLTIGY